MKSYQKILLELTVLLALPFSFKAKAAEAPILAEQKAEAKHQAPAPKEKGVPAAPIVAILPFYPDIGPRRKQAGPLKPNEGNGSKHDASGDTFDLKAKHRLAFPDSFARSHQETRIPHSNSLIKNR